MKETKAKTDVADEMGLAIDEKFLKSIGFSVTPGARAFGLIVPVKGGAEPIHRVFEIWSINKDHWGVMYIDDIEMWVVANVPMKVELKNRGDLYRFLEAVHVPVNVPVVSSAHQEEKASRVRYQDLVYKACNLVDRYENAVSEGNVPCLAGAMPERLEKIINDAIKRS